MSDVATTFNAIVWLIIVLVLVVRFLNSVCLVPTQVAYVVERLGKYHITLRAGFHALLPFLDRVAYKLDLREETIDVPPQECFTSDEVKVEVDGVMYISVVDPVKASYGVTNYRFAAVQLSQTTTRSVIGRIDLDRTFEERELISSRVVHVLQEAGLSWGIKVHRYEVKNIVPPDSVKNAMERQVTAERERKAVVARAEGDKQSVINRSEGFKAELVNKSEGEMQKRVNEAEGRAAEIVAIANATAESIEKIALSLCVEGGQAALKLQLAEKYFNRLAALAHPRVRVLLPMDLSQAMASLESLELAPGPSTPIPTFTKSAAAPNT